MLECDTSRVPTQPLPISYERFAPNETIFREGQPGEKLYVILDGGVRISKNIPGTGEEALAILGRALGRAATRSRPA